eukprot:jgi/Mesvir1/7146/Mv02506-RA.1
MRSWIAVSDVLQTRPEFEGQSVNAEKCRERFKKILDQFEDKDEDSRAADLRSGDELKRELCSLLHDISEEFKTSRRDHGSSKPAKETSVAPEANPIKREDTGQGQSPAENGNAGASSKKRKLEDKPSSPSGDDHKSRLPDYLRIQLESEDRRHSLALEELRVKKEELELRNRELMLKEKHFDLEKKEREARLKADEQREASLLRLIDRMADLIPALIPEKTK